MGKAIPLTGAVRQAASYMTIGKTTPETKNNKHYHTKSQDLCDFDVHQFDLFHLFGYFDEVVTKNQIKSN